jgi:hypothetical protein
MKGGYVLKHPTRPHHVVFRKHPHVRDDGPIVHPEDGREIARTAYLDACRVEGRRPNMALINAFVKSIRGRGEP